MCRLCTGRSPGLLDHQSDRQPDRGLHRPDPGLRLPNSRRLPAGRSRPDRHRHAGVRQDLCSRLALGPRRRARRSETKLSKFTWAVRGVDRHPDRVQPPEGVERVDGIDRLDELLGWSDFAVIAAPHTPETARLFDARTLALLRHTSYLINVGRGAIVVLDDLVAALRAGRLAGVALDVYEVEPLPADHPLWDYSNVILTPHTAGYSTVIAARHLATLVENVGRFGRGERLLSIVDKTLWF